MDFTKVTEDNLFTGGEQPGSQAAYWRDLEIKRRYFITNEKVAEAQVAAARAAAAAAQAQKEAADATRVTAIWTRVSAIAMAVSVLAVLASAFIAKS